MNKLITSVILSQAWAIAAMFAPDKFTNFYAIGMSFGWIIIAYLINQE